MKKSVLLILFAPLYVVTYSQDPGKNLKAENVIGIYSDIGICQPLGHNRHGGIVSSNGKEAFSLGLKYLKPISQKLKLETGICYSKHTIVNHLVLEPDLNDNLTESLRTISIPVLLKRYYPKNYFISLGTMIDFTLSRAGGWAITDPQSGLGLILGAGKEILIDKFSIDIEPNLAIHSLTPSHNLKNRQRLFFLGLNIGLDLKID